MSQLLCLFVCCCMIIIDVYAYGTCDDGYHIEKNTIATSDSHRDYYNAYNIFPYLDDQDASRFVDGMCGDQMKVQLPDTCFKVHAPQTWEHDSGLLDVDVLEKKNSKKWKHVMADNVNTWNFDSFLDFNMAFWVQSLDDYVDKWQNFNAEAMHTEDDEFEYIGIEWQYSMVDDASEVESDPAIPTQWWSLLIHSPQSNINYEFMSFVRPSLYDNLKWITSSISRASFKAHSDPYPWNREDGARIVPVRLSRAVTDLDATIDFYVNVMESTLLYHPTPTSRDFIWDDLNGDNIPTRTVILHAPSTQIEFQFVQRPLWYTAGDFSLREYQQLLLQSHEQVISSPFCGIDRWFDNHYGFVTWTIDGYLDRIIEKLKSRQNTKYRVYRTLYEHTSPDGKKNLDLYGKDQVYIFFVFEPSGQTIQLMGDFPETVFDVSVPEWSTQWCWRPCPSGMEDGLVDPDMVYVDTEAYDDNDDYNDRAKKDERHLHLISFNSASQQHHQNYIMATLTAMVCGLLMCGGYYCLKRWKERKILQANLLGRDREQEPLMAKK